MAKTRTGSVGERAMLGCEHHETTQWSLGTWTHAKNQLQGMYGSVEKPPDSAEFCLLACKQREVATPPIADQVLDLHWAWESAHTEQTHDRKLDMEHNIATNHITTS